MVALIAKSVAVTELPVQDPEEPDALPVTLPVKLPVKVVDVNSPVEGLYVKPVSDSIP